MDGNSTFRLDIMTRSKAKPTCDICNKDCLVEFDCITCKSCCKIFHLLCTSLTCIQNKYLCDRGIGWNCHYCYFSKLSTVDAKLSNLDVVVMKMEETFKSFHKGIANYNQLNDANIAELKAFNESVSLDLMNMRKDFEELQSATLKKILVMESAMVTYAEETSSLRTLVSSLEAKSSCSPSVNKSISISASKRDDFVDHLMNSHNLLLINIPEMKNENLVSIIIKLSVELGMVNGINIKCHRLRSRNNSRQNHPSPILIKFDDFSQRNTMFNLYLARIRMKNFPSCKMLDLSCDTRFYLNECLSSNTYKIFLKGRQLQQTGKIHQVFTSSGQVFVRVSADDTKLKIKNIEQLLSLIKGNIPN